MTRPLRYLARRLAAGVFTMLVLIAVAFFLYWSTPSQPALFVYQPPPHHFTDYQIKQANHFLGLDRPKVTQYVDYVWGLLHGSFGPSWDTANYAFTQHTSMQPLQPELMQEVGVTLSLLLGGAVLVLVLSVPLGAFAGTRIGSLSDRTISLIALIGVCTHPMVIGLLLRSLFGGHLHWAPESGYCSLTPSPFGCGGPFDWSSHLLLPWFTFALLFLALYTRMVRTSVSETLHEDYVRTARAKGAREFTVISRHVLPNASLRVMTMIGMEIGTTIGVCTFIETAYGLHGLAQAGLLAMIETQNLPTTLGVVTCVGLLVVVGGLLVDAPYAVVDPRAGSTSETRTKSLAGGVI